MEHIVEWPASRRYRKSPLDNTLEPDFAPLGSLAELRADLRVRRITQALLEVYETETDPELALPEILPLAAHAAINGNDNSDNLLLAFSCMELIRVKPNLKAWSYIWLLSWHHAFLEYNLSRAAVFAAKQDPAFKAQILRLASDLIDNAVANPSLRSFTQEHDHFPNLRSHWHQQPNLTNIWWGLREGRSIEFRADQGAFAIVAALDREAFIDYLLRFDNPYPIQSALRDAGAEQSLEIWKNLLAIAPPAFDAERRWTGTFITPLLLVIARDQILQAQFGVRADTPEEEVKTVTGEIDTLCQEVASVLASRDDGGETAERWTTWLMRQCVTQLSNSALPYPADSRSGGYTDSALVDAIGKALPRHAWSTSAAPDAEPWEVWSYRCVLVVLAAADHASMPNAESFIEQWALGPDEWATEQGNLLRARASLFETVGNRADAYGTRLLAVPLAESEYPPVIWTKLWEVTQTIRDIVEFGDPDVTTNLGDSTQFAAGRIMRLIFGLGLMMLDCIADPRRKIASDRQSTFEMLFCDLAKAVAELDLIDQFDQNYWSDALRHLAIRRAIWASDAPPAAAVTFPKTLRPNLSDFIAALTPNTENLLALLEVALRNNVQISVLQNALLESRVNLADQIKFAEHLIELDPKRARISVVQISAARSLLPQVGPGT